VVIDALQGGGQALPHAVLDADPARCGQSLYGVPVVGDDSCLPDLVREGVNCFLVGVGSSGDNRPRRRLFHLGLSFGLKPLTLVHPAAVCSQRAVLGAGSQCLAGSIINAEASLGVNVLVNTGALVEHDCVLGDHVHVASGAQLAGGVRVGPCAHVGAGATLRQGITVGEGAVVGLGAAVVKDVPPYTVVAGVPARPLRQLAPAGTYL
jgi:UDP-perosamine 4-acetyltransferase